MRNPKRRIARLESHLVCDGSNHPLTAEEADRIAMYNAHGAAAAMALGNRGALRLDSATGRLADDILESFYHHGFYALTNVIDPPELEMLQQEFSSLLARAPVAEGSTTAANGEAAMAPSTGWWTWADALGDPTGGKGRAATRMRTYAPPAGVPERVVAGTTSYLRYWDAGLRLYAHPKLLAVAASICGDDFCRFNEGLQIKLPHVGPSVAWCVASIAACLR